MSDMLKGILSTVLLGTLGFLARAAWNYVASLRAKIRSLKQEEQTRWEVKVESLTQQLLSTTLAVQRLDIKMEELKNLIPTVDKISRDITAFHIWKRVRFPDGGNDGTEGNTGRDGAVLRGDEGNNTQ